MLENSGYLYSFSSCDDDEDYDDQGDENRHDSNDTCNLYRPENPRLYKTKPHL